MKQRPFSIGFAWGLSLVVGLFALLALWVARANGSVNDEYAAHITSGFLYWRTGVFAGGVYNPPLGQLWVALPYAISGTPLTPFTDAPPIAARVQNILLAGVCLILLGFWVRRAVGKAEALCAVLLLATTPDFLAHSALATLDLPVTAAIFVTIYYFIRWFRRPNLGLFLRFACVLGVALVTKVSAFLLVLIIPLGLVGVATTNAPTRRYLSRFFVKGGRYPFPAIWLPLVGLVCVWLVVCCVYCFRGCFTVTEEWATSGSVRHWFVWPWPKQFIEASLGKFAYARHGNLAYLCGQFSLEGWWWYYPVALALKSPLPLFLMWCLGAFHLLAYRRSKLEVQFAAFGAATFFLGTVLLSRAQIGIRHLLPIYPCLALMCAPLFGRNGVGFWRPVAVTLLVLNVVSLMTVLPYPLTAESLLTFGRGYRCFADANYDWGQANRHITDATSVSHGLVRRPNPYLPQSGEFVVRVNELNGFPKWQTNEFGWLRELTPTRRIARAGLVYHVEENDLSSTTAAPLSPWRCAATAMMLYKRGDPSSAEAEIRAGVERGCNAALIWRSWGEFHLQEHRTTEAQAALRRASLLAPQEGEWRQLSESVGLKLQSIRLMEREPARALFYRANAALLERQYAQAREYVTQALAEGAPPEAVAPLLYHCICLLGDWEAARELVRKYGQTDMLQTALPSRFIQVLEHREWNARECVEVATWAYRNQSWVTAARLLTEALKRDPSFAEALNLLGELVVRYKDWSLPLTEQEKAALEKVVVQGSTTK
ncbi:MAG: phospholipid carrier-dependent glycosyltransferase [Candidatus Hydrogenedentota bacterium]|nr:glycosyltransferase family 39 protein [Candidatus Sumerlaea chitinivorans]RMH27277.1 MAG: phospholipid carrier-dependent glycosyltransferase [Candidatus Hydrogenedentota bacterium]GIX44078.1 MAG: hypothetical protein KatS3mg130_0486 [Candidatus Sumerlaea sp.]